MKALCEEAHQQKKSMCIKTDKFKFGFQANMCIVIANFWHHQVASAWSFVPDRLLHREDLCLENNRAESTTMNGNHVFSSWDLKLSHPYCRQVLLRIHSTLHTNNPPCRFMFLNKTCWTNVGSCLPILMPNFNYYNCFFNFFILLTFL